MPTPKQIGARLKKLRTARQLSRYELARRAGLSRSYITRLEQGLSDPTVGVASSLARELECTLAEFLNLPAHPGPKER